MRKFHVGEKNIEYNYAFDIDDEHGNAVAAMYLTMNGTEEADGRLLSASGDMLVELKRLLALMSAVPLVIGEQDLQMIEAVIELAEKEARAGD